MQMEDFLFAGEQIIADSQPFHGVEDLFDVAGRDIVSQLSDGIISGFDGVQDFNPQLQTLRVRLTSGAALAIKAPDARVKVPTVIIKRKFSRKGAVKRLNI